MLQILLFKSCHNWHLVKYRFGPFFQSSLMKIMLLTGGKVIIRLTMCQHHESLKPTKVMTEGVHTNLSRLTTCVIFSKEMFISISGIYEGKWMLYKRFHRVKYLWFFKWNINLFLILSSSFLGVDNCLFSLAWCLVMDIHNQRLFSFFYFHS